MKPLVIGPGKVATPYGTALSDLLSTKHLAEAIIASAFLTVGGAERLVDALRRAPKGAKITVVVGSMAGFTRKAAIRYLQSFVSGSKRKLLAAKLKLVHPFEEDPRNPCFHAKAAYVRAGQRRHLAIDGSHNLTDEGLESAGELGVWLEGKPASPTFARPRRFRLSSQAGSGRVGIHERRVGNQRSSAKTLTARRWSAVSSGASITVGRRPGPPVVVRTRVARMPAKLCIMARAETSVPSAILARLTRVKPRTVAKVCNRSEPSAH